MPLIFERSVVLFFSLAILLAFSGLGNSADSRDPETWYLYVVNGLGGKYRSFSPLQVQRRRSGPSCSCTRDTVYLEFQGKRYRENAFLVLPEQRPI
ncbi:hypothetical protein M0R45_010405 [Rubus argutus]|uniref:Secreted protein n=1 Tax=Rubus argutus TaxID=59490 RepID=A0AAW1Y787_RUBAR